MSGVWKGVALTLITVLVIIFTYNLYSRSRSSRASTNSYDQQVAAYYKYLEEQSKKTTEYFIKLEDQLMLSDKINTQAMENQKRFSKLLDRWEKQSDNFEKLILDNNK